MKIIALCGKGGVGKDTILKGVMEDNSFYKKVSYTTRPPRPGEIPGKDYIFVNEDKMVELAFLGELLEVDEYNGFLYGTGAQSLSKGKVNIGIFSPDGMFALKSYCESEKIEDFFPVLIESSDKERFIRMLNRDKNATVHDIYQRFKEDEREFEDITDLNNLIILQNETWDDCAKNIEFIQSLKK